MPRRNRRDSYRRPQQLIPATLPAILQQSTKKKGYRRVTTPDEVFAVAYAVLGGKHFKVKDTDAADTQRTN